MFLANLDILTKAPTQVRDQKTKDSLLRKVRLGNSLMYTDLLPPPSVFPLFHLYFCREGWEIDWEAFIRWKIAKDARRGFCPWLLHWIVVDNRASPKFCLKFKVSLSSPPLPKKILLSEVVNAVSLLAGMKEDIVKLIRTHPTWYHSVSSNCTNLKTWEIGHRRDLTEWDVSW